MLGKITNAQGENLDFVFHAATPAAAPRHLAVIGHGVTANLDRPFVKALADGLAAAGVHALRFSFSGNGNSEGRFQDSCITKEVADLGAVIDAAEKAGFTVSYCGHSMGGAVGVLRAASDSRILHLVGLAPMVTTQRFAETEFGMVEPDAGNMWDEESCPLSSTFMNDLRSIGSTAPSAAKINVPVLLVHGSEDDLVPIDDSRALLAELPGDKTLVEVPGANHVFSGDENTKAMVDAVVAWLKPRVIA